MVMTLQNTDSNIRSIREDDLEEVYALLQQLSSYKLVT